MGLIQLHVKCNSKILFDFFSDPTSEQPVTEESQAVDREDMDQVLWKNISIQQKLLLYLRFDKNHKLLLLYYLSKRH